MATTKPPTPPEARPLSAEELFAEICRRISNKCCDNQCWWSAPIDEAETQKLREAIEAFAAHVSQPLVEALERCRKHFETQSGWDVAREMVKMCDETLEKFRKGRK